MAVNRELVKLFPQLAHGENVLAPKAVAMRPVDEAGNIVLSTYVDPHHAICNDLPLAKLSVRDLGGGDIFQNPFS